MGKYSFEFLLPSNNNGFYVQKNEKKNSFSGKNLTTAIPF